MKNVVNFVKIVRFVGNFGKFRESVVIFLKKSPKILKKYRKL